MVIQLVAQETCFPVPPRTSLKVNKATLCVYIKGVWGKWLQLLFLSGIQSLILRLVTGFIAEFLFDVDQWRPVLPNLMIG